MKLHNRPARLNRSLLSGIGLVLLAAGAFELTTRFGVLHLVPRHQPLSVLFGRYQRWVPYLVAAAAVVIGLAALRWLAAQAGVRPRTGTWRLPGGPVPGVTALRADTAAAPLVADIEAYPGVRAAAAWLTGSPGRPQLHLRIRTEYDADLTELRERISEHALPRLRAALELRDLPAVILITPTAAATARTR